MTTEKLYIGKSTHRFLRELRERDEDYFIKKDLIGNKDYHLRKLLEIGFISREFIKNRYIYFIKRDFSNHFCKGDLDYYSICKECKDCKDINEIFGDLK